MHATLGQPKIGDDLGHERGLVVVPLAGGERDRLYIDRERVTEIKGDQDAVKVWFHETMYLGLSG